MNTKFSTRTSLCLVALLLAGCSEVPKPAETKAEAPKPPEPVTGLTAIYEMYKLARNWAKDIQGMKLTSANMSDIKSEPGKAPAWQATFVSASLRSSRSFGFSAVETANTRKGVTAGPDSPWTQKPNAKAFELSTIKVDTEKAYQVALGKAGDYMKKNPNVPVMYVLEYTDRFKQPAWRVVWGESVSKSNFSVFVDATTGDFLKVVR